ncbi:hypothetical protein PHYSODRAFT_331310 [Phytophthora sojae]|uniref:Uncharacterized protein n=1 Tax=Phytophthora sojae (strain P6497) TaxID=1094619 RepID=G4ZCL0_PHYSP|nr:hypothetical protein PHYSODRAFT_331310 [Phytophthora sojae]EGZ17327.1 hypothetical protein PHYSODRAFT_331310 [Phytophthora sojae]|eukprot:XP_009526385.1 hypothetical protein PHYSODRAFT_331310 [Phytophthora sojae]
MRSVGEAAAARSIGYAVGVYDRKTKVRLCNVNQIYVMQQATKNASENQSKRIQKSREENIVDLEHISGAASVTPQTLQKKISAAKKQLEDERSSQRNHSKACSFCISPQAHQAKSPSTTSSSTMGRKDKKQQQAKEEQKPAAEKNAGNAKGGNKEQPAKEEKQKGGKKGKK